MADDRFYPFSCGSQAMDWQSRNCARCRKWPGPDDPPDPTRCEIDDALGHAMWSDGSVSAEMAERMGYIGNEHRLTWDCPERRTIPGQQAVSAGEGSFWWAREVTP